MTKHNSDEDDVFSDDAVRPERRAASATAHVTRVGAGLDLMSIEASAALYRLHVVGARATLSFFLEAGEHVIGRGNDADVRVDDDSMSRRHARLTIAAGAGGQGERLSIVDLGSLNGTRVRERTIKTNTAVDIAMGESFELGSVMFVLQRRKTLEKPRRRIYDHSYLETRVDEEIARRAARRTAGSDDSGATLRVSVGSGITLVRVHIEQGARPVDAVVVEEELEAVMPKSALCAEYAPGELEILFLDEDWDDIEAACDKFVQRFAALGQPVRTGFAVFPRDGRTASSLLSVANAKVAVDKASPELPSLVVAPQQESGAMDRLQKLVERVAPSDISIVIHGETGVGKEVMARQIHNLSHRAGKPFVGLNCAALTETLLESELFGHERGSFSGAVNTKPGLFEVAEKGTVFLDEIGEMSPAIQAKLLRVLEERTVLRVGGLSPRAIDVRFLAASHKDLEVEAGEGRFRQDLYFRLNGITLEIPPLRDRVSELEHLVTTFIADVCRRSRKAEVPALSKEGMALLRNYSWPGNIRELRNTIERAVILCTGNRILPEHLPVERLQRKAPLPSTSLRPAPVPAVPRPLHPPAGMVDDDDVGTRPGMRRVTREILPVEDMATMPPRRPSDSLKDAVSDLERERIIDALKQCGGNQTKAAEMLGISRRTLLNRLDAYNLPRPRK